MSEPEEEIPKTVLTSLQKSGFLFQTLVAHVIRSKNWIIHASEYPWRHPGDESRDNFLDLIARSGNVFLTIECKKTKEDDIWTFLLPLGPSNTGHVENFRCIRSDRNVTEPIRVYCETWAQWPVSPCAEFCVVATSKGGDQRLLERDASLLISATDAFALDVRQHVKRSTIMSEDYSILPVIVTNARLYTTRYKPPDISLSTGRFEQLPADTAKVPWVRFEKSFTVPMGRDHGPRTLFVVNAPSLGDFLDQLETSPKQLEDKARTRLW